MININDLPISLSDTEYEENNKHLTDNISISYDREIAKRNTNTLVVGCSGCGKSFNFVKPNLMNGGCSFIVTDLRGEYYDSCHQSLEKRGYEVSVVDFINPGRSFFYNPFDFISGDSSYRELLYMSEILSGIYVEGNSAEPFWNNAFKSLLTSVILYVYSVAEYKNLREVVRIVDLATQINDEGVSDADALFGAINENNSISAASVKFWKEYSELNINCKRSIAFQWAERSAVFHNENIIKIFDTTSVDIDGIGNKKSALFFIVPVTDRTVIPFITLIYSQIIERLYKNCTVNKYNKLSQHVEIIADEFSCMKIHPDFDKVLAIASSCNISFSIIVQNITQLGDERESIVNNCDSLLIMSAARELNTFDYYKSIGLSSSEITNLKEDEAIVLVRGFAPVKDRKLSIENTKTE
jgi:type IV secretion system protein VirD4